MKKEKPILFNAEMVRAILDGRKTQTRRLMKPQPKRIPDEEGRHWYACNKVRTMVRLEDELLNLDAWKGLAGSLCPYGGEGDQLWVRETCYEDVCGSCSLARYSCGDNLVQVRNQAGYATEWWYSRPTCPSIHMPRWASRIDLLIKNVRVERLQEISKEDAQAEGVRFHNIYKEWGGVEPHPDSKPNLLQWRWYGNPVEAFKNLWRSTYGLESWDQNPWVWVIEFVAKK